MEEISYFIYEYVTTGLEIIGALIIVSSVIIAAVNAALNWRKIKDKHTLYHSSRITVGRGILLGLELLIAADIVRTVGVQFTLRNISLLGLIVLIRIILGFTLEVEISGKWPWQNNKGSDFG
ncbi:MAG: DUF1622 domain-containing protein [Actinomycetota bacterium]